MTHTMASVVIPGLPADLRTMPPELTGPDDPEREAKVTGWMAWAQRVVEYRRLRWAICDGLLSGYNVDKERERERILCEHSPLYAIVMYMHVYESDPERLKRYPWWKPEHGGWLPAIPFWFQARYILWLDDRLASKDGIANGVVPKPRRVGMTDWTVNWALAKWLFAHPFSVKFVSRNQSLVYDKGNMDAILQRAIAKLDDAPGNAPLPGWMMPPNWSINDHVAELKVRRPDSMNLLGGEATTGTAGRGGRATIAFLDEAAVMRDLMRVVGSVQATAPHVILISSETLELNFDFDTIKRKAEQSQPQGVFGIEWWEHPFQDRAWLEAEEQRYIDQNNHAAFFREILRQPYAGETGWMYADARERTTEPVLIEPRDHEHAHIELGIDPGFRDETAIHWLLVDPHCGMDVVLESYEASGFPPEYYAAIIAGVQPDDFPEFYFSESARDLMAWVRGIPRAKRICGDPAGTQSHAGPQIKTGKDDAWYSRMIAFWYDHDLPVLPVVVNWDMKSGRELQGRRLAMMEWLRRKNRDGEHYLRFNPTPSVAMTLDALKMTKWEETDKRTTEMKDAIHTQYSHRRSGMEYLAVNRTEFTWTDSGRPKAGSLQTRRLDAFVKRSAA